MGRQDMSKEMYASINRHLFALGSQLYQPGGYRFNLLALKCHLQDALEGRFGILDYWQDTAELSIALPPLKRPTIRDIQRRHPHIISIERDTSPEEPITFSLVSVLCSGEHAITGLEYQRRLLLHPTFTLGYQHWSWILQHQRAYPSFMALMGKLYIDFPGIVAVSELGGCGIPCCNGTGTQWDGSWSWLDNGFYSTTRVASISKEY